MSLRIDPPFTEHLDLHKVDLLYKRVEWVDGFDGMEAVIRRAGAS